MAAFVKFQDFAEQLGKNIHNLNTHTFKVYLSNELPLVGDTVKTDIAEIAAGFGYVAGGVDTLNTYAEVAGVGSCVGTDFTITAAGGSIGPFRYAVLYNDDATAPLDALIGYWDYGSAITLADGEGFTVDFGTSMFTVT